MAQSSFAPQPLQRPGASACKFLNVVPSPVQTRRRERAVSFRADRNELHLGEIVASALRRRLYPNSLLRPKQLAYDLRISERTVWNLLSGNRPPAGETLWALCNFLGPDFIGELFGCQLVRLSDRRQLEAIKKIEEGHRELREATGGREE